MIAFSDPERPHLQELAKHRIDQAWRRGTIGDITYIRSLVFAGEDPSDAASRLNMLKAERDAAEAERARQRREWMDASRAWMEQHR